MPRLVLMRHAKSSWDDSDRADFDRPLNERGRAAALAMGRYLAEHDLLPDRIVCSTARRTRETLAGVLSACPCDCEIGLTRVLYEAHSTTVLECIRTRGGVARAMLVIGHNPGIQQTAQELAGSGEPALIDALAAHFPTAALAVFDIGAVPWSALARKDGRLAAFVLPRDLAQRGAAGAAR